MGLELDKARPVARSICWKRSATIGAHMSSALPQSHAAAPLASILTAAHSGFLERDRPGVVGQSVAKGRAC